MFWKISDKENKYFENNEKDLMKQKFIFKKYI